ncbi:hypothetical protein D3C71_1096620 [compost metagenome]
MRPSSLVRRVEVAQCVRSHDLREHLLPRAPKISPEQLIDLGERYACDTDYPIQYQWTLLKGINDGDDELESEPASVRRKVSRKCSAAGDKERCFLSNMPISREAMGECRA